jgi:hypothetical protein
VGTPAHLAGEMLNLLADIKVVTSRTKVRRRRWRTS